MPTKGTSVKGIRLADSAWKELDTLAAKLGMTRNQLIGRWLTTGISDARRVRNSDENVETSDEGIFG